MNQTQKNEHNKVAAAAKKKVLYTKKYNVEKLIFLEVETIHKYKENINNNISLSLFQVVFGF